MKRLVVLIMFVATMAGALEQHGDWKSSVSVDAMTDEREAIAMTHGVHHSEDPRLVIDHDGAVLIFVDSYFTHDTELLVRLDDGEARAYDVDIYQHGMYVNGIDAIELVTADKVVMRFDTVRGQITTEFSTYGAVEALDRVLGK